MSSQHEPPPHNHGQPPAVALAGSSQVQLSPHSQEAEEALIGSMLIDDRQFGVITRFLRPSDFYILRNAWAWEAMQALYDRGDPIEFITVVNELRAQENRLDKIGGAGYLNYTIAQAATAMNAESYGQIIRRASIRRQLLEAANNMAMLARDENIDIGIILKRSEALLYTVTESYSHTNQSDEPQVLSEFVPDYVAEAGAQLDDKDGPFIPTAFTDLNNLIEGWRPGLVYFVAAHSGVGKSAFALSDLKHQAANDVRALYATFEMPTGEHLERLTAMGTGIGADTIARRKTNEAQWLNLLGEWHQIEQGYGKNIAFWDAPTGTIPSLRRAIQTSRRKLGGVLDVVYVDHIRLMESAERTPNMADRVAEIAQGLKNLAKSEKVAIVALVQFNSSAPRSANTRATFQHVYGGSAILQAADGAFVLHRPEAMEDFDESGSMRFHEADLFIDKFRSGGAAGKRIELYFDAERTRFCNLKRERINVSDPFWNQGQDTYNNDDMF